MQIDIRVSVRPNPAEGFGELSLSQVMEFRDANFADMAEIMAKFHALAMQIKVLNGRVK